jgi:hypothetical protein
MYVTTDMLEHLLQLQASERISLLVILGTSSGSGTHNKNSSSYQFKVLLVSLCMLTSSTGL